MTASERERNRAVRIAYSHARAGDRRTARRWLDLAASFAEPTPRQCAHVEALADRAGPYVHPGQLKIAARPELAGAA